MSKSYRVTLRRGKPGASSSVTTSVQADNVMDAQAKACRLFPAWSCAASEVKEEQDFDECVASGTSCRYTAAGACEYCGKVATPDTKSTAHIDRSGATVRVTEALGAGSRNRRWQLASYMVSRATMAKLDAAAATCEHLGYTFEGGEQWKPPIGVRPDHYYLLGQLLAVIHRDGGHYQAAHGASKATGDAIAVVHELRAKTEEKLKTFTVDVSPVVNNAIAGVVLDVIATHAKKWEATGGEYAEGSRNEATAIGEELRQRFARAGLL